MSRETEKRLEDMTKWFFEHRNDGELGDVHNKLNFILKTLDCVWEMQARQQVDIQELEGRSPESLGSPLWIPSGVNIQGSLERRG